MTLITDYRIALKELIILLKSNKDVKVEKSKINKPVPGHVLPTLLEFKISLPESLLQFYRDCDGCHLVWRDKQHKAAGELHIVPATESFLIHWKNVLWFDWMNEAGASEEDDALFRLAKTLIGFDVMDHLLDKTLIIALEAPTEERQKNKLWYWDTKGAKFPLTLSLSEYLPIALRFKGMLRWQLFYADLGPVFSASPMYQAFLAQAYTLLPLMDRFMEDFARLFPDTDIENLQTARNKLQYILNK